MSTIKPIADNPIINGSPFIASLNVEEGHDWHRFHDETVHEYLHFCTPNLGAAIRIRRILGSESN
ncbi:MAG: hypothetical protein P4L79_09475 [Legionella sp.]|uniref:hypothetical protein n=1 Tax=Legionella sp. TaxID=459 RepID=UPI002842EAB9|nr:hypothetical protein [Legionella sp.]